MSNNSNSVKRVPVDFRYDAINPDFLKALARIGNYAAEKYGSWEQYTAARLEGDKSCINHIYEHLRQYQLGEVHDKFGNLKMQLAAIAYNAMMEWYYLEKFGPVQHPLKVDISVLPSSDTRPRCVTHNMPFGGPYHACVQTDPVTVFKVGAVDGEDEAK